MSLKLLKQSASIAILIITTVGFIYYFKTHPEVGELLRKVPLLTLAGLLILYIVSVVTLVFVLKATLRLCKLEIGAKEMTLVTAYSSVINFFGPLQSGPAFRAAYLYKKYKLNLKSYAIATLAYYLFYGLFSCLFLVSGIFGWWTFVLLILGGASIYLATRTRWLSKRLKSIDAGGWYHLAVATFVQVVIFAVIYTVELKTIDPAISIGQGIVYAGAANLALFVSLTPGAIGFREAFLLFSQKLHHIGPEVIVAANILDRTLYITLMLILGVFIFASHANTRLQIKSDKKTVD